MNKPPLYNLPSGRRERRLATLRAIAVYLLALTALAWTLTQHIAWQLRFAPALGEPWLDAPPHQARLFLLLAAATALVAVICAFLPSLRTLAAPHLVLTGVLAALALGPLYSPAHLFHWAWQLRDIAELQPFIGPPIRLFLTIATGGGLVLAAVLVVRLHTHPRPDTHGSAHWAGHHEVEKAGLLGRRGLLLGLWQRNGRSRYLRHDGPEHLFVFAPTRTGKGVGVVLPNLLSWPGSVLVH
ncbi:MAG: type IV secretory system conjugative DNA transfer family protein, partial [Ketobacter sp.]|nr:type IV secretory system conjugative DNA transfer family protein [Ketobacter sp.]